MGFPMTGLPSLLCQDQAAFLVSLLQQAAFDSFLLE